MTENRNKNKADKLILGRQSSVFKNILSRLGQSILLLITAIPTLAVLFILFFIVKESLPFFKNLGFVKEFFTSTNWSPSKEGNPHFGALSIFYGTFMITLGACAIAVPLGILVAVCLSEIVSKKLASIFKPVAELLAAIPSVAYGFFAIVIFAPLLQNHGGALIAVVVLVLGTCCAIFFGIYFSDLITEKVKFLSSKKSKNIVRFLICTLLFCLALYFAAEAFQIKISSGTNALNASIILAIMALPTIVSISQDAISSVGRDMREGSFALGGTRFETIFKVILPCAKSGIAVGVILGFMRVLGETMVVWMASGNSLKIPEPFYNFLEPVRTLTATIAGEMGEADQSTGSARYHVLFAMSLCLLVAGLSMNAISQWIGSGMKFKRK